MRSQLYALLNFFSFFFKPVYSGRLRVLAYHKVPDKRIFEEQVAYLSAEYNIISIEELLAFFEKKEPLPKNSLLITFDDGDISVYKNGMPILKKYNLSSCLFIITKLINTNEDVWIKRVEEQEIKQGKPYHQARERVKYLKNLKNSARVKEMENYPMLYKQQLTTENLKELEESGMFIGNHTHTHPMLDKCTPEEIEEELQYSKKIFTELNLKGFDIFAYPNGNANDKTDVILKNNGMKLVFLFDHKINRRKMNPLKISRIMVDADTEIKEFKTKISGVHPFFFNFKKGE